MRERFTFGMQLTLASTAIVAVAVIVLGTVAFLTVRVALMTALDARLTTTAQAIRSVVDVRHRRLRELDEDDHEQFLSLLGRGVNGAILRADGSVMASDLASPPATVVAAIGRPAATYGTVSTGQGTVVFVAMPILEDGTRYGTVAAWVPRGVYDDAIHATLVAIGIAGIVVVALTAAAGRPLSRRMLRPVTELSGMISAIEASDLTERVGWDGPDDELARLCATFDRLLDRLEAAFAAERRFIADASHELRTPLSVLRAEVELALMHDRSPEVYRAALERLQRETQRLEALARSLLLTARHDAGVASLQPVDVGDVARAATERMQPLAETRAIALTSDAGAGVEAAADAAMLQSAIVALIDNALRFARGTVRVDVTRAGGTVTIRVSDDGPGFTAEGLREATNRFWRDDPSRSGSGTGLGLAIARAIIERHHGSIALQNGAATGAVVDLTLPASPSRLPAVFA